MFENKSVSEIYNIIITGLQNELNTNLKQLQKSFANILAKVFASVYITLYKLQAWIFLQLFVDTEQFMVQFVQLLIGYRKIFTCYSQFLHLPVDEENSYHQGNS